MLRCPQALVPLLLGLLVGSPLLAQTAPDANVLRVVHATRSDRLETLEAERHEVALRFVVVAEAIVSLSVGSERQRRALLARAQELADRIVFLDDEIAVAEPAVRESRDRLILALEAAVAVDRPSKREAEQELDRLRATGAGGEAADPLASIAPALSDLARVVAEEHARAVTRHGLQDELRLFLGNLRLFDETGMPPSAGTDAGGDPDPGCPVSACPLTGFSPADVPLAHVGPHDGADRDGAGAAATTLASLARLQDHLAGLRGVPAPELAREPGIVRREIVVGTGALTFRSAGERMWGVGPKAGTSLFFSRSLGTGMRVTVEPSLGGRAVRADPSTAVEVAGEVRETLAGAWGDGRLRWQVMSWQKGRFLSDPLPLPGYLEPGRMEGGVGSRLAVPLRDRWDMVLGAGGDLVRYAPEDWKVLDRQGLNASLGMAWHGDSGSGRVSLLGSRHGFSRRELQWEPRREDNRVGVEADGSFEGRMVVRLSAGLAWNDSRLPAYDYRSARAAVVLSAPWGGNSIQAYGALAHQAYLNPGPEDARVAPSDQDTGSIVAVQFNRPLTESRALVLRAEWSRSKSGFQREFFGRFGTSVQLTFRGLGGT
jgi:hypothetical protein